MKELLINLALALIWLFLSDDKNLVDLAIGWGLGFAVIAAFHRTVGASQYVYRSLNFLKFLLIFVREFLLSNLQVAIYVLTRSRRRMRPDFVSMDISELNTAETILIAHCITLTPGTTAVIVSEDCKTMLIHMLDPSDAPDRTSAIRRNFVKPVLAFTRGIAK